MKKKTTTRHNLDGLTENNVSFYLSIGHFVQRGVYILRASCSYIDKNHSPQLSILNAETKERRFIGTGLQPGMVKLAVKHLKEATW